MNDPRRDTVLPLRPRRQRSDDLAWSTTQDFADLVVFIEEGIIARMEDLARRLDVLERLARR
ncbi:hypothetical protein FTX61_04205 [Nitriliruptoraceae bacterium ZYF776]|nr:hypothetical protein [Profundirhabdus halotolerans]